ncbi:hypothetical protein C8J57DRAFT_1265012 [Mycena rebaudengoi]|nr:hypothetical protein C8J57DRAFT_1265012 [Mycena rebaudengoi]
MQLNENPQRRKARRYIESDSSIQQRGAIYDENRREISVARDRYYKAKPGSTSPGRFLATNSSIRTQKSTPPFLLTTQSVKYPAPSSRTRRGSSNAWSPCGAISWPSGWPARSEESRQARVQILQLQGVEEGELLACRAHFSGWRYAAWTNGPCRPGDKSSRTTHRRTRWATGRSVGGVSECLIAVISKSSRSSSGGNAERMKGNIYAGLDGKEWGAVERTRRDSSEEKNGSRECSEELCMGKVYLIQAGSAGAPSTRVVHEGRRESELEQNRGNVRAKLGERRSHSSVGYWFGFGRHRRRDASTGGWSKISCQLQKLAALFYPSESAAKPRPKYKSAVDLGGEREEDPFFIMIRVDEYSLNPGTQEFYSSQWLCDSEQGLDKVNGKGSGTRKICIFHLPYDYLREESILDEWEWYSATPTITVWIVVVGVDDGTRQQCASIRDQFGIQGISSDPAS